MQVHQTPVQNCSISDQFVIESLHFGTPGSGKKVYIQAGLHADEPPGMLVAQFLRKQLAELESRNELLGEVILVPAANPIGRAQSLQGVPFGRFDFATGVNFNRGFKHVANELKLNLQGQLNDNAKMNIALIRRAACQIIQGWAVKSAADSMKKILLGLAIDADIVLDLHCDNEAVTHLYTGTPLAEAFAPLAALIGAHATLLTKCAGGEPFDEACSRLWWDLSDHFGDEYAIPPACLAATVELKGERDVSYELAQSDADSILDFLAISGVISNRTYGPIPTPKCEPTDLEAVEPLIAPHAGLLVYLKHLGATVSAGEHVADLIDPVTGTTSRICSSVTGKFFARSAYRHVQPGMNIGKIAGNIPFRSGDLMSL